MTASMKSLNAGGTPKVLPQPIEPFKGKIAQRGKDSTAAFPTLVTAPKGAPNVLLVLLDDVGFGASQPFGGPIATPTLQALAARGLLYNRFHTTAMCSPTRAAMLTGRTAAQTKVAAQRSSNLACSSPSSVSRS